MEANTRHLERIFDQTIVYQIPLFQRPYVWVEEANWKPLWLDIQSMLDKQLTKGQSHPHFLGAVVFEQISNSTGSIEARQVIDGQQRLTTLQLLLLSIRDNCEKLGAKKYLERFADFTANKESRIDNEIERYKVWPTNSDRDDYIRTHRAGSPTELLKAYDKEEGAKTGHNIPDAYLYFYSQIHQWLSGDLDYEDSELVFEMDDRLEALWQVVRGKLQLVVIDLGKDDESQVIFETLNARGTQLLPGDLIKNYLFHKAEGGNENVEHLYAEHWQRFDSQFWRQEIKQGRIKRPRIDIYLQHYLSLKMLDDVRVAHLFNTFKNFVEQGTLVAYETIQVGRHLESMSSYGRVFETFFHTQDGSRLSLFIERLAAIDTATVYPFLLEACHTLSLDHQEELDRILIWLESFLIRRMVCGLTSKNYNKLFIDLVKASVTDGKVEESRVINFLLKGEGDSNRFPDDIEFKNAWMNNPIYKRLAQYKVKAILSALDAELEHSKSEQISLPSGLTIEHVMPQSWQDNWPLITDNPDDLIEKQKLNEERELTLQTMGNLTLITGSLNPALSNAGWDKKKPELIKFSKLNLNRYFHDCFEWSELDIKNRGEELLTTAAEIWPFPK